MAVIFRVAGGEFAGPVQRQSHPLHFNFHGRDVAAGPFARMHVALAGRVFRGQAERIPPHRVHHVVAARPLVARHHIAQRVVAHMAHVDLAAGIREHFQHVVFRAAISRHVLRQEAGAGVPFRLPTRLGGTEIIARRVGGLRGVRCWCGRVHQASRTAKIRRPVSARSARRARFCHGTRGLRAHGGRDQRIQRRQEFAARRLGHGRRA